MVKRILFSNGKSKVVSVGLAGALLLGTPAGISYAHGNHREDNKAQHNRSSWQHSRPDSNRQNYQWHQGNDKPDRLSCDERQAKVDQKVADYKTAAQARLNNLNNYVANQQTFVQENNLTVKNYEKLNTKVTAAQTELNDAVNNLTAPTIDCDKSTKNDNKLVERALHDTRVAKARLTYAVKQLSLAVINS